MKLPIEHLVQGIEAYLKRIYQDSGYELVTCRHPQNQSFAVNGDGKLCPDCNALGWQAMRVDKVAEFDETVERMFKVEEAVEALKDMYGEITSGDAEEPTPKEAETPNVAKETTNVGD